MEDRPVHEVLKESWALIGDEDKFAEDFYSRLFTAHPEVRHLFPGNLAKQKQHLLIALGHVLKFWADRETALVPVLRQMGIRHVGYGAREAHYPAVGATLMEALRNATGEAWKQSYEDAWTRVYTFVSEQMLAGARHVTASVSET